MAFFVVARTADGNLALVCPETFSSRQAAMSALAELTRDPAFPLWDAELLVADLDSAVPVLLVRPTAAESAIEEPEESVSIGEDVVAVGAGLTDVLPETIELIEPIAGLPELPQELEEDEGDLVAGLPTLGDSLAEPEEPEFAEAYELEDLAIGDAIAEEILAELELAKADAEPEIEVEVEPVLEAEVEIEAVAEVAPAAEIEAVAEVDAPAETDTVAEIDPEPAPLVDTVAEVAPEPETDDEVAVSPAAETDSDSEPAAESSVEQNKFPSVTALVVEEPLADAVLETQAPADAPVIDEVFGDIVRPQVQFAETEGDQIEASVEPTEPQDAPIEASMEATEPEDALDESVTEPEPVTQGGVVIAWPWDTRGQTKPGDDLPADVESVDLVEPVEA